MVYWLSTRQLFELLLKYYIQLEPFTTIPSSSSRKLRSDSVFICFSTQILTFSLSFIHCRSRKIYKSWGRTISEDIRLTSTSYIRHCLFAKVFTKPLIIFPNHIKFMVANTDGTPKTKTWPKVCILITYWAKQVRTDSYQILVGKQSVMPELFK